MSSQSRRVVEPMAFADSWAGAAQPTVMPIPNLLRGLEAIVVAVVSSEGELKDANRGFLLLMTRTFSGMEPADVRELFASPRFEHIVRRRTDPFEGTIYRGLLSFGQSGGRVTSLRGAIYRHESDYVVVAEHDIVSLETLRSTLLELQDDLTEKQRHIVQLEQRVARLQELSEAALRDRDTLLDALARHGVPHSE